MPRYRSFKPRKYWWIPEEQFFLAFIEVLNDKSTWRRHPKPFAKTLKGLKRYKDRHFIIASKEGYLNG